MAGIVLDFVPSNISEHIDFVCVYLSSVAGCLCLNLATAPNPTPQRHAGDAIENRCGASYNRTNTLMFASKIRKKVLLHSTRLTRLASCARNRETDGK